jgi:hypothetical protein
MFAQGHALLCPGVAIEACTCLLQNSQAGSLNKKMSLLTLPTDSKVSEVLNLCTIFVVDVKVV